jgi:hypothetical protein
MLGACICCTEFAECASWDIEAGPANHHLAQPSGDMKTKVGKLWKEHGLEKVPHSLNK